MHTAICDKQVKPWQKVNLYHGPEADWAKRPCPGPDVQARGPFVGCICSSRPRVGGAIRPALSRAALALALTRARGGRFSMPSSRLDDQMNSVRYMPLCFVRAAWISGKDGARG